MMVFEWEERQNRNTGGSQNWVVCLEERKQREKAGNAEDEEERGEGKNRRNGEAQEGGAEKRRVVSGRLASPWCRE
jgi:hypothetical protein